MRCHNGCYNGCRNARARVALDDTLASVVRQGERANRPAPCGAITGPRRTTAPPRWRSPLVAKECAEHRGNCVIQIL